MNREPIGEVVDGSAVLVSADRFVDLVVASGAALVADARSTVRQAGDAAMHAVAEASKGAPEAPGFWSKVGDVLGAIGHGALNLGAGLGNGLASFGNAVVNHPGDVVTMLAGVALTRRPTGTRST